MAPRALTAVKPLTNEPPPCEQAQATRELAAAVHAAVERFGPAADTVAGFGDRLDALCKFLRGAKPWLWFLAALALSRTVNMAPDDIPKLIEALSKIGGHG